MSRQQQPLSIFRVLAHNGVEATSTFLCDIVLNAQRKKEKWAEPLIACDLAGFLIDEDGVLYLSDDCGNITYAPTELFRVEWIANVPSGLVPQGRPPLWICRGLGGQRDASEPPDRSTGGSASEGVP